MSSPISQRLDQSEHITATQSAHCPPALPDGAYTVVVWVREHDDMYSAVLAADQRHTLHLLVEELGDTGWDWHVWDINARFQQRYGLAGSAAQAKAQAEAALGLMITELNRRSAG